MHELYLVESILNIVKDYEKRDGFKKVNNLVLSLGRFSSIEPQALQFAFEVQSRGTIADGAVLEFKILPAVIHCFSCEKDLEIQTFGACPGCSGEEVILTAGTEELQLLEMDVD